MDIFNILTYLNNHYDNNYFDLNFNYIDNDDSLLPITVYNEKHKFLGELYIDKNSSITYTCNVINEFLNNLTDDYKYNEDLIISDLSQTSIYYFLNNCYTSTIVYKNLIYSNLQSAYEAQKEPNSMYRLKYTAIDGYAAIKLSKTITNVKQVSIKTFYDLLKIKFSSLDMKQKLLLTDDKDILYLNQYHDNYFGSCTCEKCNNKGKNLLGKLLVKLRTELVNEQSKTTSNTQT